MERSFGTWIRTGCVLVAVVVAVMVATTLSLPRTAGAQQPTDPAQELADRYAPILVLKEQAEACDPDGEQYEPT